MVLTLLCGVDTGATSSVLCVCHDVCCYVISYLVGGRLRGSLRPKMRETTLVIGD